MPKGVRIRRMASKVFLTYGTVAEVVVVVFFVLGRVALCWLEVTLDEPSRVPILR